MTELTGASAGLEENTALVPYEDLEGDAVQAAPRNPALDLMELLEANAPAPTPLNRLRRRNRLGQNLAATSDPLVLARRAYAMPLWNEGLTGTEIAERVNAWLKGNGQQPVTVGTVREDHERIFLDWEEDYDSSSAENRVQHIAALNRIKAEAMQSYRKGGPRAAAYLKIAMQAEVATAALDGSRKRADVQAEQAVSEELQSTIIRVYRNVNLDKV